MENKHSVVQGLAFEYTRNTAFLYYRIHERGGLMRLLFRRFLLFTCTFAHMCISFADMANEGSNIANFLFVLYFFFCGVLATPDAMPRFWGFLFRVSPLSYWVSAVLSTGLTNVEVTASNECSTISYLTARHAAAIWRTISRGRWILAGTRGNYRLRCVGFVLAGENA